MHVQPEILCAAGVPGQLLDHGHLEPSSPWNETSNGKTEGQDTDTLSSGVVCKNSGN